MIVLQSVLLGEINFFVLIKKRPLNRGLFCVVDNSFEISNISLTPKDLIDTHHIMTLIMKS
jgi:hypothetical protein